MSKVLRRRWTGELAGLSRRDRRSCEYEAYVPDALLPRRFVFDGDVAADVADAEAAISRLNVEALALVDTEALARILLRAEAVASSRRQVTIGRRNRAFEAPEVIAAFTDLERQLASPQGNTRMSRPRPSGAGAPPDMKRARRDSNP